ncbi:MAG: hypothetical protein SPC24_05485, partial [Alphaproteobacteria bacterium]|nr:hypothetical protein [Alphaproteobacteria bacterium]
MLVKLVSCLQIFSKNSVNTFAAAEKVPLIRCSGFAERERDLCLAYFSSFFPLKLVDYYTHSTPAA